MLSNVSWNFFEDEYSLSECEQKDTWPRAMVKSTESARAFALELRTCEVLTCKYNIHVTHNPGSAIPSKKSHQ